MSKPLQEQKYELSNKTVSFSKKLLIELPEYIATQKDCSGFTTLEHTYKRISEVDCYNKQGLDVLLDRVWITFTEALLMLNGFVARSYLALDICDNGKLISDLFVDPSIGSDKALILKYLEEQNEPYQKLVKEINTNTALTLTTETDKNKIRTIFFIPWAIQEGFLQDCITELSFFPGEKDPKRKKVIKNAITECRANYPNLNKTELSKRVEGFLNERYQGKIPKSTTILRDYLS